VFSTASVVVDALAQVKGGAGGGSSAVAAGAGVKGSGITLINAGHISGAFNGAPQGSVRANAVEFTGGVNSLELRAGYAFDGNVVAFSAADTLKLGGTDAATFDVTQIGAAAQYRGFGAYEKVGASTWTLAGASTAATPWTVSDGVLAISADGSLGAVANAVTLNGGTLQNTAAIATSRAVVLNAAGGTLQTDADFSMSGMVSGAGALTKSGAGILTLTGRNTYAGGTRIVAGTLAGSAESFGSGAIANDAVLVVDQPDDGVLANNVSGTGSLTKQGSGQLTLAGQNTYSGGTRIVAGSLVGSAASLGSGAIVNDAALVIDQPTDAVLANDLSGSGSLTKQGAGRLSLTGTVSLAGSTSIEGGTLAVNGSLANSAVNVANGATLGGNRS
jgi:fibronectin-binding autotransporter adhesin